MSRALKIGLSRSVWLWDGLVDWWSALARNERPGNAIVLYYHEIERKDRDAFCRQMDEVLKAAEPVPTNFGGPLQRGKKYAGVTFDDGFVSVIENALPALTERRIPATMFVPTGSLGGKPRWISDPKIGGYHHRVLSAAELKELRNDPVLTIASHSVNHPNFLRLTPDQARHEFSDSKLSLEEIVGKRVDEFSFPHGAHNAALVDLARDVGYFRVFTVEPRRAFATANEFATGRVLVDPKDAPEEFKLKLASAYRWQPAASRFKARLKSLVARN